MTTPSPLPHHAHKLQPYYSLIAKALATKDPSDYDTDETYGVPKSLVRMCEQVAQLCSERGGHVIALEDVLRQESCAAGHSDYHRKFAFYCTELERYGPTARPAGAPMRHG